MKKSFELVYCDRLIGMAEKQGLENPSPEIEIVKSWLSARRAEYQSAYNAKEAEKKAIEEELLRLRTVPGLDCELYGMLIRVQRGMYGRFATWKQREIIVKYLLSKRTTLFPEYDLRRELEPMEAGLIELFEQWVASSSEQLRLCIHQLYIDAHGNTVTIETPIMSSEPLIALIVEGGILG